MRKKRPAMTQERLNQHLGELVLVTESPRERVLKAIADGRVHAAAEVAESLEMGTESMRRILKGLSREGLVTVGRARVSGKGGSWLVAVQIVKGKK